jgi:hypothetical protein
MRKVKVSLSLAHVLVQNLTRESTKQSTIAFNLTQSLQVYSADGVEAKLLDHSQKFQEELKRSNMLLDSLGVIKIAIGRKNGELQLNALLSERKVLERRKAHYELLINGVTNQRSAIDSSLVGAAFDRLANAEQLPSVIVKVIGQDVRDALAEELRQITKAEDLIGRKINALNQKNDVEFELDPYVADLINI